MMSNSDEEYTIPLQDQRVFGAGLKRKRVQFVPSSDTTKAATNNSEAHYSRSVSETYLSLVLPQSSSGSECHTSEIDKSLAVTDEQICGTCSLPILHRSSPTPHAATLAHQLSLPHSHPPSSLAQDRIGVRLLRAKGWDPDARMGLGASGEGIRFPIKVKEKNNKLGIGMTIPKPKHGYSDIKQTVAQIKSSREKEKRHERGRATKGWLKKNREEEKRRSDKLQQIFYESEEVSKYLH